MLKTKNIVVSFLLTSLIFSSAPLYTAPRLSAYPFGAASVLLVFIINGTKYLIVSREAHGIDVGTYDDFGGKRDLITDLKTKKKYLEPHPVITAAREFYEEAILDLTTNLSLRSTKDFIDIASNNTEYIIASQKAVIYVTNFGAYQAEFFKKFYSALAKTKSSHSKEKDSVARIKWDTLTSAIVNSKFNTGVSVQAEVLNPRTRKFETKQISLRPFFVKKMRPFFTGQNYVPGEDKRIRFYDSVPLTSPIKPARKAQQRSVQQIKRPTKASASWWTRFKNWLAS